MPEVRLKFDGGEIVLGAGVTTLGRTTDNAVSFPEDSNVSRCHAEIEMRGVEYCLIDLNSSNGTTLNGQKLVGESYLKSGDVIVLGGSSQITFETDKKIAETEVPAGAAPGSSVEMDMSPLSTAASHIAYAAPQAPVSGGSNTMLMAAGGACLLAVVFVVVAGAVYYSSGSSCNATAKITKPEAGDTITAATEIEVDATDSGCVSKAIFTVDGVEFASTSESPFTATIDPKEFPDLSDGFDHNLAITLIDEVGNTLPPVAPVMLVFETREVKKPDPTPEIAQGNKQEPPGPKGKEISLIEVQEMSKRLVKQMSGTGNFAYNVSNKQFLQEVQKKTAEYAQEGYFERASKYRDAINIAYVREQNLSAPLGYVLAMSRSKFNADKSGSDEGLWKMSTAFVSANAYSGPCGTETLSDPSQNCAAKASALYMKAIVFGVFDGDVIYSAAAFGKAPQDAGVWKASLPANRSDVWNSIKTAPEREQLVRFFAAGIVAENPQKFGLKKDRPISELYRLAM
ncbi:MAG: FHA domain-containing protein [Saprospiraceae bacterium]|nr:FHA domain-containing protein [Pyrinomonadaceae bacterium]